MATQLWLELFQHVTLTNLIADRSNHSPILMQLADRVKSTVKKQFKFENAWLEEENIQDVVLNGWAESKEGGVLKKLNNCSKELEK